MPAGGSARAEALASRLRAEEYQRRYAEQASRAARFELAATTEQQVVTRLEAIEVLGWRLLADRRWPGSRTANVDLLMVGPGGVLVVDVKAWRSLQVIGGSVFCDDECRDDDVASVLSLASTVEETVADLGLAPLEVLPALVFAGRRVREAVGRVQLLGEEDVAPWAARRGDRLTPDQVDAVFGRLEAAFPAYDATPPDQLTLAEPHVAVPRHRDDDPALFDVADLETALLEAALAEPIESWMTFLHPDQVKLVRRSWNGPARVRGPVGTGKTVVGLHRAAYLATTRPGRLLYVSFVRTLPLVLSSLFARLAPNARDRVEFTGLHRLAVALLRDRGGSVRIDTDGCLSAYNRAWLHEGRAGPLGALVDNPTYWKEEIDYVVKGRGLTRVEEYEQLTRVGRRTPMRAQHRAALWDLYLAYEAELDRRGIGDFNDLLIEALDAVRRTPVDPPYAAVIVDEVQDLNLVGLRLMHALAGDGPDSLFLVGDGQQAVYPGGFTLSEAGVSVSGRATVLRTNYRNTSEILDVAAAVVATDSFDDLDGAAELGRRDFTVARHGGRVVRVEGRRPLDLETAMVAAIEDAVGGGVRPGDIGVLVSRLQEAERCHRVLRAAGIDSIDLHDYDGVTSGAVKVGTFKRAKGLEFARAFLPYLNAAPPGVRVGESPDAFRERAERARRELFVGMTRARDVLWLGYLCG